MSVGSFTHCSCDPERQVFKTGILGVVGEDSSNSLDVIWCNFGLFLLYVIYLLHFWIVSHLQNIGLIHRNTCSITGQT